MYSIFTKRGVFNTTINSLKILYAGISNFRHLTEEDMEEVEKYRKRELAEKTKGREHGRTKKTMNQSHVLTRQDRNGGAL